MNVLVEQLLAHGRVEEGWMQVRPAGDAGQGTGSIRLGGRAQIGRCEGDIRFEHDPRVSREHAVIEHRGSRYVIRDLGSTNGTWVNGNRAHAAVLHDGDVVVVGTSMLVFHTA